MMHALLLLLPVTQRCIMSTPHIKSAKPNIWTFIYHHTYARGYTRIPIVLAVPLTFKYFMEPFVENEFKYLNKGHTQEELWQGVEERTKLKIAAEASE